MSASRDRNAARNKKTAATATKTTATTKTPAVSGSSRNAKTGTTVKTTSPGATIPGTTTKSFSQTVYDAMKGSAKSGAASGTGSTGGVKTTTGGSAAGSTGGYKTTTGGGAAGSSGGYAGAGFGGAGSGYGGYNNGGLTAEQVKQLQAYYGTDADGMWGANSTASAGGLTAQEAWQQYRQDLQRQQELLNAQRYENAAGAAGGATGGTVGEEMSWEEYLDKMGAANYQTKLQEAISAQVQKAVDDYNRQIKESGINYEEAARREYISKMLGQRNMDQQLAASGVYGGMADSQRIAMEANYQNNLTDLKTQYADTIAQLEQAVANARLSGDAQMAEQMASYLSQVQGQYSSYLSQLQQERAAAALAAQQAQAQSALLEQENSYSSPGYSSSGGSGGGSSGNAYTGGSSGSGTSGGAGTARSSGAGVSNYAGVKNNILMYASRGMNSVANRLISQTWDEMNEAQQNDLIATMRQKGYIS